MKKIYLSTVIVLAAHLAYAQPEITIDNMPVVGDYVPIAICGDASNYEASGANVTWDMSSLSEAQEGFFDFIDPQNTYWGYQFEDASLCGYSWDSTYTYYSASNGILEGMGLGTIIDELSPPYDTVKMWMTDTEVVLDLPWNYGDTNSDSFAGVSEAYGFQQSFTGTNDIEYDGYGTLILPTGTYTNAARYHGFREQLSTGITQSKEQWIWMSPDYRFWLLLIETVESTGSVPTTIIWYNKNPTPATVSVDEVAEGSVEFFPNPAQSGEQLYLRSDIADRGVIRVLSLDGKVVLEEQIQLTAGINTINLPQITPGMAIVQFNGTQVNTTQRVLIQ
ncbi:MAG: T9SS type A sorting domain-containing protein [Flavobacteriales bacterium]|nr:T9SS type A sorting domain-containing protein [Flavobacteriales bacterium]